MTAAHGSKAPLSNHAATIEQRRSVHTGVQQNTTEINAHSAYNCCISSTVTGTCVSWQLGKVIYITKASLVPHRWL
jgi:hypothetical protein